MSSSNSYPEQFLKSFPSSKANASFEEADWAQIQLNILDPAMHYPIASLSQSAIEHNLAWMAQYAKQKQVLLAPHGKTTMSPQLFTKQLNAGAWGLTFATLFQAKIGIEAGARNIIIANQVVSFADLDALLELKNQYADLRIYFLIDSLAQLNIIQAWHQQLAQPCAALDVLIEIGITNKRTGCRTTKQAQELAQAIASSQAVQLKGLECYEGNAGICNSQHDSQAVSDLILRVQEVATFCDQEKLFASSSILISAGGSAIFDLIIPLLKTKGLQVEVQGVLRSGCYITHDHIHYRQYLKLVEDRENLTSSLKPALLVWAMVQSVPEAGLALLSCGKRDISYDLDLPQPVLTASFHAKSLANASNTPQHWRITALNDQHAYLHFDASDTTNTPQVGDKVALGISHPCTTFDKWRWMPIVDDKGVILSTIRTWF